MHPSTSVFNQVKSRLHTPGAFRALGAGGLAPDIRRSVPDELVDLGLRTLPMPAEEHCGQAVCRWINAIYGCTHRHAQLNDATHRALNEMFGFGNIDSLKHLSLMMRRGLAVTHTGGMDDLHPERIADTQLLLLQGSQNYIFHPLGSLEDAALAAGLQPRGDYQREVLPGYAHLDAIIGTRAAVDVYPRIVNFLDPRYAPRGPTRAVGRRQPRSRGRLMIAASSSSSAVRIADSVSAAARSASAGGRAATAPGRRPPR